MGLVEGKAQEGGREEEEGRKKMGKIQHRKASCFEPGGPPIYDRSCVWLI